MIQRALIIDEPWIGLILNGQKDWEMRSTACRIRGPIGLIRKGSGLIVGIANLVGCSGPYSNAELERHISHHHVSSELTERPGYGWRHAWELEDVVPLTTPVAYRHKSGAVKWVTLDDEVSQALSAKLAATA